MVKEEIDSKMEELEEIHETLDGLPSMSSEAGSSVDLESEMPEQSGTIYTKYRTEADVPKTQKKYFEQYLGAYGRHVALSNTRRADNIRHLNALDLQYIYDEIPVLRHRAGQIRIRETSEFQMCRSNPETGGFEAKLGVTAIRRENVDVKQAQSLTKDLGKKKKKGILGFLRR